MIRFFRDLMQRIQGLLNNPQADAPPSEQKNVKASSSVTQPVAGHVIGSHLISVGGLHDGQIIPLLRSRFIIGRDPALCDLAVTQNTLLSRRHTALFYENEQWFCADLGSTNGTFVDSSRVTQAALPVLPGSILRCGGEQWRIVYGSYSEPTVQVNSARPPHTAGVSVRSVRVFATPPMFSPPKPSSIAEPHSKAVVHSASPLKQAGARWISSGEAVTIHGVQLPHGMIYFGSGLLSMDGGSTEPALIDPGRDVAQSVQTSVGIGYYPAYASISPEARRNYLRWLSSDRRDPTANMGFVFLFFYGIERRLISPFIRKRTQFAQKEADPTRAEAMALRREIRRLAECYQNSSYQHYSNALLQFLALNDLLGSNDKTVLADPQAIEAMPKRGVELPPILAASLARIAIGKQPLTADWAWAWLIHDHEFELRTTAIRCREEMHRLFSLRFAAATERSAVRLTLLKSSINCSYRVVNPGCQQEVSLHDPPNNNADTLYQVSRTPLKAIREIACACIEALDVYSRRVGRDPEKRNTLAVVALLPDPLFAEHPEAIRFRKYLDAIVSHNGTVAAATPVAGLIGRWQATDSPVPLSRSEAVTLLEAVERLGFVLEPDVRSGAPLPSVGKEGDAIATIARRINANVVERMDKGLYTIGLPLLVRAARASGVTELHTVRLLSLGLPRATHADPGRLMARLGWLMANPRESVKLPKQKEPMFAEFLPEDRAQVADSLVSAASHAGTVSPGIVAELVRLFALLGLTDSEVFERLHASASGNHNLRRGLSQDEDEPLTTIHVGKSNVDYAIPKPPGLPRQAEPLKTPEPPRPPQAAKRNDVASQGVAIDLVLVRQKEAESAQISSLLADIFNDEEPVSDVSAQEAAAQRKELSSPVEASGLDARHATLLRALILKESWSKAEITSLARARNLLINAAIETINEAAFDRFDEPVMDGDDPIHVSVELAKKMIS